MASIDERVVAMSFENSKFEASVSTTMATLSKLDRAIAGIGKSNGLASIEASANKVTLTAPMTALDKLKAKLGFTTAGTTFSDMEKASSGVTLNAPMSALDRLKAKLGFTTAGTTFNDMEKASDKVTLAGPMSALDKLKQKLGFTHAGTTFTDIEKSADKVTLETPMSALDKLKARLGRLSSGTTFSDIEAASSKVTFSSLHRAIDDVSSHFSTMKVAVGTAIGGLALQVGQKGAAMVKSLALDPIIGGFQEYQTNLNSIQTILANTKDSGGNLKTVNSALQELNTYSDKTIYNFSQMARNIGTFTAAGVHLKPAVAAIKGIANLAALSGSNSEQASTAMYQLSQAIASGKVGLQDWNSVVNAGMGGAVFQKALMRTGENMGTIAKGALKVDKATGKATISGQTFRDSIMATPGKQSWLTSDVLTKTLSQFTGDMSDAQLAADGFNASQIQAIQQTAKSAQAAATEVKTLPQVFDVAKETIGSGWSQTFQTIFGNFSDSKKTFTALSQTINGFINTNSKARNKVLADWAALGGRTVLIDGIKNAFKALMDIVKPIRQAFRDIFPSSTGKALFDLTVRFRDLMKHLQASPETMDKIKRTFRGFFAVLHIGWTIIKTVASVIGSLLGASKKGAGGILAFTARIGDFLTSLDKAVSKGGALKLLFHGLKSVIEAPLAVIKALGKAIIGLFSGAETAGAGKFSGVMSTLHKALGPLGGVLDTATRAWHGFIGVLEKVKTAVSPLLDDIGHVIGNFGEVVANGLKNANYDKVFTAVQTVLVAGIFRVIKQALGSNVTLDFGGGVLKSISGTFKALTGNLEKMQRNIQAHTLLTIAAAIALLAAAVVTLSLINPKKLTTAMTAVAVGMGELVGAMVILNKALQGGAFGGLLVTSASLVILAGAMVVFGAAVKIFSTMSWGELARGLGGVAASLLILSVATKGLEGKRLFLAAAGLTPLAVAMNILAVAVKIFATMSWEQLAKGLIGVSGALAGIGLAMELMPPSLPLIGAGLILVSTGLLLLSGAVAGFGHLKLETLVKGVLGIAGAMVAIGLAMELMPPNMALQAASLILISIAMTTLSGAIAILGNLKITTLIKGIVGMGAALVVLGLGLDAMSGSLAGSAALVAAAFGLGLLAPVLEIFGHMAWGTILKGLGAMALTLTILGIAGGVASVPLTALGVAILALGVGLLSVGAAAYLFAKAISMLSDTSTKGIAVMITAITVFIAAFPKMLINFLKGIVAILDSVVTLAPKIVGALVSIISQLLDGIIKLTPKIAQTVGVLITGIVAVLNQNAGPLLAAGFKLLITLLAGIGNNIGRVADKGIDVITHFLGALARNAPRLIASGAQTLVHFLNGITSKIPNVVPAVANLIATFLTNVAKNLPRIIASGANLIATFIRSIASQIPKLISAGTNIIVNFIRGVGNAGPRVIGAAIDAAAKFVNALAHGLVRLVDVGYRAIINFLNGLAATIRKNNRALWNAGWNVANAIIDGLLSGLGFLAHKVAEKALDIAKSIPGKFLKVLGISSPSKVMMEIGRQTMSGLAVGLDNGSSSVVVSMTAAANDVVNTAKSAFGALPDALAGAIDTEPVIAPVLDLSNVEQSASLLGDLLKVPVVATTSTQQASVISDQNKVLEAVTAAQVPVSAVNFEQNNYSPDPLSNIEIYRQTNNQLSRIKSLVGAKT